MDQNKKDEEMQQPDGGANDEGNRQRVLEE